ncbi:MAG: hypothetical protein HOB15_01300 [Flavobacteriales bacterium]|jgi:hypothetical protein|nr:hypothetical protein [Flavobacteriales bacterium]
MGKTYKKIIKNKYDKKKLNKLKHKGDDYYGKSQETWVEEETEEERPIKENV